MFEGFVYLLVFVFCFLFLSLVFIGLAICVGVAFFDFILFWIFSALESIGLCLLPIREDFRHYFSAYFFRSAPSFFFFEL